MVTDEKLITDRKKAGHLADCMREPRVWEKAGSTSWRWELDLSHLGPEVGVTFCMILGEFARIMRPRCLLEPGE